MGSEIDRLAKALASGATRREALGAIAAGGAALLPWTAAGKDRKKRRRQRRRIIGRTLEFCQFWCGQKFTEEAEIQSCINAARTGKGPCYSASEKGPGHFCLRVKSCGDRKYCCPSVLGGDPVTEGSCCAKGTTCGFINSTVVDGLCVV
jgi:hypothetical protein